MRRFTLALPVVLMLAACREDAAEAPPPPYRLTADTIGYYCGMNVLEHRGPKGQIILASRKDPIWFSSARDAFSFSMLPEEPKEILAIYVSDMGQAPSWDSPGDTNWIDAKTAYFVIDSRKKGGMGASETVPFSEKAAAERFARQNGGRVVAFAEVPQDYVLGGDDTAEASAEEAPARAGEDHNTGNEHRHGQSY